MLDCKWTITHIGSQHCKWRISLQCHLTAPSIQYFKSLFIRGGRCILGRDFNDFEQKYMEETILLFCNPWCEIALCSVADQEPQMMSDSCTIFTVMQQSQLEVDTKAQESCLADSEWTRYYCPAEWSRWTTNHEQNEISLSYLKKCLRL